jgi:hypothetical protein
MEGSILYALRGYILYAKRLRDEEHAHLQNETSGMNTRM